MTTENDLKTTLPYAITYDVDALPDFSPDHLSVDERLSRIIDILNKTNVLLWDSSKLKGNSMSMVPHLVFNPNFKNPEITIKDVSKQD